MQNLSIGLLGPLEVVGSEGAVALPPSKKARALLAYLVATGRPQRRDHLVQLLWDTPDDPRAALRWCLSRLRKILNDDGNERIVADRESVEFVRKAVSVDHDDVRGGPTEQSAHSLISLFRGNFLDGLEVPDCLAFSAWRAAQRDECDGHLAALLTRALEGEGEPDTMLRYARRLVELRPRDANAHTVLVRRLCAAGRVAEAEERVAAAKQLLQGEALAPVLAAGNQPPVSAGPAPTPPPAVDPRQPPAVAVLPFNNMSGNAEQDYFADGMCEDIITDLARARLFPVIARNSSFAFKGRAFDIRDVAAQLGAAYVVEGSVRAAGKTVRVTAQLIDAPTGHHVWAARYDRPLEDVFAVQDEIARQICGALRPELADAERTRLKRSPPKDFGAWHELVAATAHVARTTPHDVERVRQHCQRAIELDPSMAEAHAILAGNEIWGVLFNFPPGPEKALPVAMMHAQKALALDPENGTALLTLGWVSGFFGKLEEGQAQLQRAVELDPSSAFAKSSLAASHLVMGQLEAALDMVEQALTLSPRDHVAHFFYSVKANALYLGRDFAAAAETAARGITSNTDAPFGYFNRAAALAQLGQIEEARACFADGCVARPDADLAFFRAGWPFRGEGHAELVLDGLRKCGLSD